MSAVIVDPAPASYDAIVAAAAIQGFRLEQIWITHSHWDHIADTSRFKKALNIPIYIHEEDRGNLINPGSDGITCMNIIEGVKPDYLIADGDRLAVGNIEFKVIHTPGHSPGGVCFYSPSEKVLISGDTLFRGTFGTLEAPTAQPQRMWESLAKLALLPAETKVYPGHGMWTTIGRETWLPNAQQLFGQ
jgi:glyoxylase-like metal-dependent hydrolase (beta-lactamase superfamily II)